MDVGHGAPTGIGMPQLAGISLTTPQASYRKQRLKGQGDFGTDNGAFLLCDLRSKAIAQNASFCARTASAFVPLNAN
jgi:hypothetical protein